MFSLPTFEITQSLPWAIITFFWGFANLFFGYRLFRLFLAVSGAFIGAQLAQTYLPNANAGIHLLLIVLAAIVTSVLAYSLYSLTFVLLGGLAGLAFAYTIAHYLVFPTSLTLITIVFGVLIGVALGSVLKDLIIVLATAAGGATLLIKGVELLLFYLPLLHLSLVLPAYYSVFWIVLFILGMLSQLTHYSPRSAL